MIEEVSLTIFINQDFTDDIFNSVLNLFYSQKFERDRKFVVII